MLDHLDDPAPFAPGDDFHGGVAARVDRLRRQRRRSARIAAIATVGVVAAATTAVFIRRDGEGTVRTIDPAVNAAVSASASDPTLTDTGALDPSAVDSSVSAEAGSVGSTNAGPTIDSSVTPDPAATPQPGGEAPSRPVNILILASDSRDCIDPASPYAGAFGSVADVGGSRSDTMIVARLDPANEPAISMLSFGRDLWVNVPGRAGKSRLNSVADTLNPQKLIDALAENFAVPIDHYVNLDFCSFKAIVDALGGVDIPIERPIRDRNTGLAIEQPACHTFGGDEALAYVRSRRLEVFDDASGTWENDPTSDIGRMARQRDFIARVLRQTAARAAADPALVGRLLPALIGDVVTDSELTLGRLLGWIDVLDSRIDSIEGTTVAGIPMMVGNANVLRPDLAEPATATALARLRGGPIAAPSEPAPAPDAIVPAAAAGGTVTCP